MATTMTMTIASGYPTEDSIRVNVSFTVTYAASYYTYFELYNASGRLVDSAAGSTFAMGAGETKSGIYKTFTDLDPSSSYTIVGSLWNAATGTRLDINEPEISFTTDDADPVATIYYARVALYGNGGTYNGSTSWTYENWGSSWGSYADIDITYRDPGFVRAGYSLSGWSTSNSATSPSYAPSGTATVRATSDDENAPTTLRLYAVWASGRPVNWEWTSIVAKGSGFSNSSGVNTVSPLTAAEWRSFISRIQAFAVYRGATLSSSYVSAATSGVAQGSPMTAVQVNAARYLINQLAPPTAVPASVTAGAVITAAFVNDLKNSLNSIP